MMTESGEEDPSLSYQPMPAMGGEGKEPQAYSAGSPPRVGENSDGPPATGSSSPFPASVPINPQQLGGPIFILCLMTWHFFWTTWSNNTLVGSGASGLADGYMPQSWFFYAYSLIAVGLWAAADVRPLPALAMVLFFGISILCDYMFMGIYLPPAMKLLDRNAAGTNATIFNNLWRFGFASIIINHLTKYLSVMVGIFALIARGGLTTLKASSYNEIL